MKILIRGLQSRLSANDFAKLPAIIALILVGIGILLSYLFADTITQQSRRDFEAYTRQQDAGISNHMSSQIRSYEQLLLDNAGIFSIRDQISYSDWRSFIRSSRTTERYPSILAIGFVRYLTPGQVDDHVLEMKNQGIENYAIYPESDLSEYTPITFIEPINPINQKAIGYDMATDKLRLATMSKARDSGSVQMTPPLRLIQDVDRPDKKGVLLYYPIYDKSLDATSLQSRRDNIKGFVYIAVRPEDILMQIDRTTSDIDRFNYTMTDEESNVVLASQQIKPPENVIENYETRSIRLLGRSWKIDIVAYQPTLQRLTSPGILLLLGIGLSTALGIGLYRILRRSFNEMQQSHEETLIQTKNDLLALASHQLRTPASGVKQYLGILTQGFMGELTEEQQIIARKAYIANERQLETINQILHVAKADAGQLALDPGVFDIVELTRDVIEGMEQMAEQKDAIIKLSGSDSVQITADERYVRMIIENLISNAIKYSDTGRVVRVGIKQTSRYVKIGIRDYGVGIAPDDLKKMFLKFSRVNNKHSRKEGGTGLGLFLAYHIAKAHGGDITISSVPGEGSTFTLVLPYKYNTQRKRRK